MIAQSPQVSKLAAIKVALLPLSSEPPSCCCGCCKGHRHSVWCWKQMSQEKSQTSPLVTLSWSKQSDHTVVITAIRWDKAAAKPKVICRLKPGFSGAESVTAFGRKCSRNVSQPCFTRIMWILTGFSLILVFWSDVKFSFETSFLKQILFWTGQCGSKRNTLTRWLLCGSQVHHMQDGNGISAGNMATVNVSALEISAFLAQSSPIIHQFTKDLLLLTWHCLKVMLALT